MNEILVSLRAGKPSNLKTVVVAGHSAGGQFVTWHEIANTVHESLGVPVQ